MINVETVDLTRLGVRLPSGGVGMVIAQPYLTLTAVEPYRCTAEAKAKQLDVLRSALAVALAAPHGAGMTHFTVFPEYSIPGVEGIALVEEILGHAQWQPGTIVIGGTDALSKTDFETLLRGTGTHVDAAHNGSDRIGQNEWINCGITWVKGAQGGVERWLQPKLFPAGLEQDVTFANMFRGSSVFVFKGPLDNGTEFHFCTLICFDWVANIDNTKAWRCVLEELRRQIAPAELSLSWLFVIQSNRKPSHATFLREVSDFFDQNFVPNVRRDRTCLTFANSAGKATPGRTQEFGATSLIFSGQTQFVEPKCHPTFSKGGQRFRGSLLLAGYRDVFFSGVRRLHTFLPSGESGLARCRTRWAKAFRREGLCLSVGVIAGQAHPV